MNDIRPNPDELLARLQRDRQQEQRGSLKIFFGFAPGVGKTYAMLQEAQIKKAAGVKVTAGIVETHKRSDTEMLLDGFEILTRRRVEYHGVQIEEFDLDAALAARPDLLLVDELAHTNAPGSRHEKRWQDVEELLQAGINVYTTLNVQHLESLNDVVAQITGVTVRETVPDSFLELAAELELIDISPEDLLQRLQEGKVYIPDQANRAAQHFFRKGNLIALRELSLRQTAARVGAQMRDYKQERFIHATWPTCERLLVCVTPSPTSARLVRAAYRMAEGFQAEWFALNIALPSSANLPLADKDRLTQTQRLAEHLGAKTKTIASANPRNAILDFARENNITKILVGKPCRRRLRDILFGSVVDDLIWHCGTIDVYVITGEGEQVQAQPAFQRKKSFPKKEYMWGMACVGFCTLLSMTLQPFFALSNLIMIYLLGVVLVAQFLGRSATVFTSILSVAAFDFFFVPPHHTFAVADTQYFVTLVVMSIVGLLISTLVYQNRFQAELSREKERQTATLFDLSCQLSGAQTFQHGLDALVESVENLTKCYCTILLPDQTNTLVYSAGYRFDPNNNKELEVAHWVFDRAQIAGHNTATLAGAKGTYFPIRSRETIYGVLRVEPKSDIYFGEPEQFRSIEAYCGLLSMALERDRLSKQAQQNQVQFEMERMRNTLLSVVSHDLRTPLTAIAGSASSLLESSETLDRQTQDELIRTICDESQRMNRLVNNLLEMSRLQSGAVQMNREWHVLEEIVGTAIASLQNQLERHPISICIPENFPLIHIDALLIERVFVNLLDNAVKYSQNESPIEISAQKQEDSVVITVADRGIGLPNGEEEKIFEQFFQGQTSKGRGVGLGLALSRSIIVAHGGKIWATRRSDGGTGFHFSLPQNERPPIVETVSD